MQISDEHIFAGKVPADRKAAFAIFMSGSGTNAEKLLTSPEVLAVAEPVVLVTDALERSRSRELSEKYSLPLVAVDIREFYRQHGLSTTSLATEKGREVRELWTEEMRRQLQQYKIDFAVLAGFESLCNITNDYPCLNVHPADLSVLDSDGNRCYVGLHSKPVEAALLAGETSLRSSVIIALPYTDADKDMDNGILLGLSREVPVDFDGLTLEEMKDIRAARQGKKPAGGWNDKLEQLAQAMQNKLKFAGDHFILPLVVRDFASRCFAYDGKQLYYRADTDHEFAAVKSNEYTPEGVRLDVSASTITEKTPKKRSFSKLWAVLALLLLTAMIAGFIFWQLPKKRLATVKNEFLLPHQLDFRVKSIQPASFNTYRLQDIELGPDKTVLFSAPRGEIKLDASSAEKHMIKSLHLEDAAIKYDPENFTFNGFTVEDFLQKLTALPVELNGRIPLYINGYLILPDNQQHSKLTMTVAYDQSGETMTWNCRWETLKSKRSGSWSLKINRKTNSMDFFADGSLQLDIFKKLLLKAGVRQQALQVLRKGEVNGKLQINSPFPDLELKNIEFSGKISNSSLRWYNLQFNNVPAFEFAIKKHNDTLVSNIQELKIKTPAGVLLKKITMNQKLTGNTVKFTALCDLRQTAVNALCHLMGAKEIPTNSTLDKISGSWNMNTHKWYVNGNTYANYYQQQLKIAPGNTPRLELQPQDITFKAQGVRNHGKISKFQFGFYDLGLKNDSWEYNVKQGYVDIKASFGKKDQLAADTVSFNLKDVTFKSDKFSWHSPDLNGQLDIRNTTDNKQEVQINCTGSSGEIATGSGKAVFSRWGCQVSLDSATTAGDWHIPRFDFTAPDLKFNTASQIFSFNNMRLYGSGRMTNCRMIQSDSTVTAEKIASERSTVIKPVLKIRYDANKKEDLRYDVDFFSQHGVMAEPLWGIKKFTNCKMLFSCGNFDTLPTKLTLKASELEYLYENVLLQLRDTTCQLDKKHQNSWESRIKFSSVRINTSDLKYGSGSLSDGEFFITLATGRQNKISDLNITGEARQPSWRYRDVSAGGEVIRACIIVQNDQTLQLSGNMELVHANLLGEYFSASTPLLKSDITMDQQHNIRGSIDFASGSISSRQGDIEFKKVSFKLPWLIAEKAPEKVQSGRFSAAEVLYKQRQEGSLDAELQHLMLIPGSLDKTVRHTLKLSGGIKSKSFSEAPAAVELAIQLPPERSAMQLSIDLPSSPITLPLPVNKYIDLPVKTVIQSGVLGAQLTIKNNAKGESKTLKLNLNQVDLQLDQLKIQNCSSNVIIDQQDKNLLIRPASATLQTMQWKDWALQDNEVHFSLTGNTLQLNNWQGKLLGGKFKLANPLKADFSKQKNSTLSMQFALEDIPAEKLFQRINVDSIKSSIPLAGTLNTLWDSSNNKLYIQNSKLTARSKQGASLKVTPDVKSKLHFPDPRYRAFALAVMKDMICYRVNFDLSMLPGDFSILMNTEGLPAQAVPFVFQGTRAEQPFRPAEPGEKGWAGEVVFNVNFKFDPVDPGV